MQASLVVLVFLGATLFLTPILMIVSWALRAARETARVATESATRERQLLTSLLSSREETIQSLMNQVRTTDPVTLLQMQAATTSQTSDSEYDPMTDEAEARRYSSMAGVNLSNEELAEDLSYAGWEPAGS